MKMWCLKVAVFCAVLMRQSLVFSQDTDEDAELDILERTIDGLMSEVSSLRSHNVAIGIAMQALNAARQKELQLLRQEYENTMNETEQQVSQQEYQIGILRARIDEMKAKKSLDETTTTEPTTATTEAETTNLPPTTAGLVPQGHPCEVQYNGSCYFTYAWSLDYDQARRTCNAYNATLGWPVDEASYKLIKAAFRTKMSPSWSGWAGLWTGLVYNRNERAIKLPSGEDPPFSEWALKQPTWEFDAQLIIIRTQNRELKHYEGMANIARRTKTHGVLCVYTIE